jgi:hypothetical protein
MAGSEHALDHEAALEVVARENELRRFASGKNATMVGALDAAELGEISAFREVLGDEAVKETGLKMRGEGEKKNRELLQDWLMAIYKAW